MSGRKARQARRVQTPPPPTAARRRDPKLLLATALGAAVIVAAAAVGLSLTLGGNSKTPSVQPGAKLPDAAAITAVFRGIPQHGLVLGVPTAPVTLVEYLDLQCPWCDKFARETFPGIVSRYVRPGKVRVEIRPLDFIGKDSVRGRNALFAAAAQNKAFQFVALLYANQGVENTGWLNDAMVRAAAGSIPGLEPGPVATAGSSDSLAARIERQRAAEAVTGVPTFFVKRTGASGNGTMLVNPARATLETALRNA